MYDYNCPDCNEAKLQSDKNARKINEVIEQVNALIEVNNDTVDFIEDKATEIVEEKAEIKVGKMLGELNTEIDNINSSLINKANKNEVFSMSNMGQDIKEAMTGGSVAVVGENSTDIVNLKDRVLNILAEKMTSANINYTKGTTAQDGQKIDWENRIVSDFIKLNKCVIRLIDKTNYKFYVNFYTLDKTYIEQTSFSTDEVIIEEPRYIRIVVAKKTDLDINSNEIENIKNNIVIYNYQPSNNLEKIKTLDEKIKTIDENNKMTANECWYYDKELVIENYNNPTAIYIKFDKLTKRYPNEKYWILWEDVITDINDETRFVTSPNGVENCLLLNGDEVLYADKNNKIGIVHKFDYNIYSSLLCFATWGRHYGILSNLYTNTHINELVDYVDMVKRNEEIKPYPEYFATEIEDTVNKINNFMNIGGNDVAVVGFVTDTHWGANKKNSPVVVKEVMNRCKIPVLINGGDIVSGAGIVSKENLIKDIIEEKKAFSIVNNIYTKGNHDAVYGVNSYYDSYIPAKEFYNYFYREPNKNVECSNDGTCFYQDFKQEKLRVISLNVCDLDGKEVLGNHFASEENIEWLDSILNNIPNGYVAVVITHVPLWDDSECPWSSNTTFVRNRVDILNVLNKYQGKIACILSGHEHNDYIVQKGNIPQIITACDGFVISTVCDGMYRPDRESGTHTEQVIDFICINKKTKEIIIIRCGAGGDRATSFI